MGMIGTGSANDIVRGLGSHQIETACIAIKHLHARPMDIGRLQIKSSTSGDEEYFFLGTLSAGLGTTVNQYVEEYHRRHKWLSKWNPFTQLTAGLMGIRRSFSSGQLPIHAYIETTDDDTGESISAEVQFSLLALLNTPFYANGLKLIPGPPGNRLFDGLLDCCMIHTTSFSGTMKVGLKVPKGKHAGREDVTLLRSSSFKIRPKLPIDIQVDGEIIPMVEELEVSVIPGRLRVLYPMTETLRLREGRATSQRE
ncbi:MAG: hypothetical protein GY940_11970 [bacterium]|nr:hypothetical protein [bacterium]